MALINSSLKPNAAAYVIDGSGLRVVLIGLELVEATNKVRTRSPWTELHLAFGDAEWRGSEK